MLIRYFILFFSLTAFAAYTPITEVSGTVNVGNLPAVQQVSGTVNTGLLQPLTNAQLRNTPVDVSGSFNVNFPAVQTISGSVSVLNFPALQDVSNTSFATKSNQDTANSYLGNIQTYTCLLYTSPSPRDA